MTQPNSIPLSGRPTNWRIIILQTFSHRSESSEPHIRPPPQTGIQHQEEEPPEHLALKASRARFQELHKIGGNRDLTLEGHTQNLMCAGTKSKSSNLIGAWARPTCWSQMVSWGGGEWLLLTLGTQTLVSNTSERIHLHELFRRLTSWQQHLVPRNSFQTPELGGLGPNNKLGRDKLHPSTDRLPKDFLSPQLPLDMPLVMALPTRGPRCSSTHQGAGTSPSHQEDYTSLQTSLAYQGADTRERKVQSCRPSLQTQARHYRGTSWTMVLG